MLTLFDVCNRYWKHKNGYSITFKNYQIETGEIGLPITENNLHLPCGIYGKVQKY